MDRRAADAITTARIDTHDFDAWLWRNWHIRNFFAYLQMLEVISRLYISGTLAGHHDQTRMALEFQVVDADLLDGRLCIHSYSLV